MARTAKSTLLVVALLLALATTPFSSYAQDAITIEGQVTNGTAGAEVPQDQSITLEVYTQGQKVDTKEAVVDAEGKFSFEDIPGEEHGYIISTEYSGGTYFFERDYPLPAEPVELVIYEGTESSEAIEIRLNTLVVNMVDSEAQLMSITELVGVENTGDRTFVPGIAEDGSMNILRFSLPNTARDLEVQSTLWSGQIVQVETGFALTSPVPPGIHEIRYTYFAPYENGKLTFTHSFPFGATTFRILFVQDLGHVEGTGMQEMESLGLGERNYQQLEAHNLIAGDSITLDFTGLTGLSFWERLQDAVSGWKVVVPVVFGLALISLLAYVLLRKKEPSKATAEVPGQYLGLTEALARLDDRFQQRDLGRQEYLQRRRELKDQTLGPGHRPSWPETRPVIANPASEEDDPANAAAEETGRPEL